MRWTIWIWLAATLLVARGAEAAMETEEVRSLLEKMQAEEAWGEAVLTDGRVRSLRVEELEADSVVVVEVVGPLQEREAAYSLAEIRTLRTLGTHRIQSRHAAYQQPKSGLLAFLLELPRARRGVFLHWGAPTGACAHGLDGDGCRDGFSNRCGDCGRLGAPVGVGQNSVAGPSARPSPGYQQGGQECRVGRFCPGAKLP